MTNSLTRLDVQCRSEIRGKQGAMKIGGYASVFDTTTDLGWMGKERIARSAFDKVLSDPNLDVVALWNHDMNQLLGRMSSKTLRISTDSTGLEYEIDLPDTQLGRDLRVLVERGDVSGASFAFVPGKFEYDKGNDIVTHTSVKRLVDVSPVTTPAYPTASTEARSAVSAAESQRSQLIRVRARVHLGKV